MKSSYQVQKINQVFRNAYPIISERLTRYFERLARYFERLTGISTRLVTTPKAWSTTLEFPREELDLECGRERSKLRQTRSLHRPLMHETPSFAMDHLT